AGADARHQLDARVCVVTRVSLADVMQQRSDEEQIGPADTTNERRGSRGRFEKVSVHRVAVVRVVLEPAAHGLPLGETRTNRSYWSSASKACTAPGPAESSETSASRLSAAHGSPGA